MFKPYPIYDFRSGLQLDKAPWLIPGDAFQTLKNAYLYNGTLRKRRGYTLFKALASGNPITGIANYVDSAGTKHLLVTDTKRLYKWNTGTSDFDAVSASNVLTASEGDNAWFTQWLGNLYYTNNKDQPRVYDGSTDAAYDIDIDGDSSNDVTTARIIITFKNRLIILRTTESGTLHPQRARWCAAGAPSDWTNDGYEDAPTNEWINSVAFIRDHLIVFFDNSTWELSYTGDSTRPFVWVKLSDVRGCAAVFSPIKYASFIHAFSQHGIHVSDGFNVEDMMEKIPDYALDFSPSLISRCYGARIDEIRQAWWAYPSATASRNDSVLVYNFMNKSWSVYDIAMSVFGFYTEQANSTWDSADATLTWDTYSGESWDSRILASGFPILLAGDHSGNVFQMNIGGNDNGSPIEFDVKTGWWNPHIKQGRSAVLGWIDFLVTPDVEISLDVECYADHETTAWQTETLDFSPSGTESMAWKRVYVNCEAEFHSIRLHHAASAQEPEIHAIVPYFKPGGMIAG